MKGATKELLRLLSEIGGMGSAELARLTGRQQLRVQASIRLLRRDGLIHIARFDRQPDGQQGRCIPIYVAGKGTDAVEPPRLPRTVTQQRYNRRHAAIISARRYTKRREQLGVWRGLA